MSTHRAPTDPDTAMILGEIRGQLRELIHNMRNEEMKNDVLAKTIAKLESVPGDIAEIKQRLTTLEMDRHRRDGAMGFGTWFLRSPLIGWLAGFSLALWFWWKEQGQ